MLGEIHAESWKAAYAPFFTPGFLAQALRRRRTQWHDRIAKGQGVIMLAGPKGRPLALSFSGASPARPGAAQIFSFFGHPAGWGTGVAGALMRATLRRLRQDGFGQVHLWTLRDTPRSRRFYAKNGFTESGAVRGFDFGDGNLLDQVEYERAFTTRWGRGDR
ncbi:GNAT family N-acetyltransferase [Thermoactinospora rubra]|uniref:GNAT family N-acetyltransferase n=1 Tax=Thermoactinospora rubra TaxID=1088767 RepID=UPI000A0F98EE|nr:GNAT family N-acetyltransferase [Thermoactinospora rubra]